MATDHHPRPGSRQAICTALWVLAAQLAVGCQPGTVGGTHCQTDSQCPSGFRCELQQCVRQLPGDAAGLERPGDATGTDQPASDAPRDGGVEGDAVEREAGADSASGIDAAGADGPAADGASPADAATAADGAQLDGPVGDGARDGGVADTTAPGDGAPGQDQAPAQDGSLPDAALSWDASMPDLAGPELGAAESGHAGFDAPPAVVDSGASDGTAGVDGPQTSEDSGSAEAGVDAGQGGKSCGTVRAIRDDFGDGDPAPLWDPYTSDNGTAVSEQQGQLRVTLLNDPDPDRFAGVTSNDLGSLRGGAIQAELLSVLPAGVNGEVFVEFKRDNDHYLALAVQSGVLYATVVNGMLPAREHTIDTYSATAHRWWQIEERGGQVHFSTSADGVSWTVHWSTTTPGYADLGIVHLGLWASVSAGSTGEAIFDNVNTRLPAHRWCPVSSLQQDFAQGPLGLEWVQDPAPCNVVVAAGLLTVSSTQSGSFNCVVSTARSFDHEGDSVTVQVPTHPASTAALHGGLALYSWPEVWVEWLLSATEVQAYLGDATYPGGFWGAWPHGGHRWLRIARSGQNLLLQTSADGQSWTTRSQPPSSVDFSRVQVWLWLSATDFAPETTEDLALVQFDNYNL